MAENEKDKLVSLNAAQENPYLCRPEDFGVRSVNPAHGQGGKVGTAEGKDKLVKLSENQESPRHVQDPDTGSRASKTHDSMQENADAIGANFKVATNAGESSVGGPSAENIEEGLDMSTGYVTCKRPRTAIQDVPESKVTIAGKV
jgi:hypothetical protein